MLPSLRTKLILFFLPLFFLFLLSQKSSSPLFLFLPLPLFSLLCVYSLSLSSLHTHHLLMMITRRKNVYLSFPSTSNGRRRRKDIKLIQGRFLFPPPHPPFIFFSLTLSFLSLTSLSFLSLSILLLLELPREEKETFYDEKSFHNLFLSSYSLSLSLSSFPGRTNVCLRERERESVSQWLLLSLFPCLICM